MNELMSAPACAADNEVLANCECTVPPAQGLSKVGSSGNQSAALDLSCCEQKSGAGVPAPHKRSAALIRNFAPEAYGLHQRQVSEIARIAWQYDGMRDWHPSGRQLRRKVARLAAKAGGKK